MSKVLLLKPMIQVLLQVYHESKLSGSTFIGRAILPLQQVLSSTQNITRRVRIGDAGEIRLQLAFSEVRPLSHDVQLFKSVTDK